MENRFETFTSLIQQISRSIQRIKSMEMTEFGLKGIHAICIFHIYRSPDQLTQAELTKLCAEDKATVSRALSELMERKLLTDTQCGQAKKYNALLRLTEEGNAIAEQVERKVDRALVHASAGLNDEDREVLYRCLQTVSTNLEDYEASQR